MFGLRKQIRELKEQVADLTSQIEESLIENNPSAFDYKGWGYCGDLSRGADINFTPPRRHKPTLKGEVEAIKQHLGLNIEVEPEKRIFARVIATKAKATKKKGKK